jgi:hypothetical protein
MGKRTAAAIMLAAIAAPAAGIAMATPPQGLRSELLVRGGADELHIHDRSLGLHLDAEDPTDVAVVKATIDPGGYTGWHQHPDESIVIVKTGTLTMLEPSSRHASGAYDAGAAVRVGRRCSVQEFGPGTVFRHPDSVHNFANNTSAPVEFYVVYLAPAGAALLNDVPTAPRECS